MFEKVNPEHPDKVADRIAGAIVDLAYKREENPKVAVEVLIGHGYCYAIIESSIEFEFDEITFEDDINNSDNNETTTENIDNNQTYEELPEHGYFLRKRKAESRQRQLSGPRPHT